MSDNKDGFWELDSITPRRRTPAPFAHDTEAVEISVGAPVSASHEENKISIPRRERVTVLESEYAPVRGLLRHVRIFASDGGYNYFEPFLDDARRLFDKDGEECPPAPYFSYIPQYSQLSREQLAWYLFWRSRVRAGEYPPTDYSYISLFIYEIINLPDLLPPSEAVVLLARILCAYRRRYRKLDKYMAETICDYCLLHELPPPTEALAPVLSDVIREAAFKEFYLDFDIKSADECAAALTAFAGGYDWHASKFAQGEGGELMARHIPEALSVLLSATDAEYGSIFSPTQAISTIKRDLFCGSLCASSKKHGAEIEYANFSRSFSLRFTVGDAVKYCENKIRAALGIKSRLSVSALPVEAKVVLDGYFDSRLQKRRVKRPAPPPPEYEKFYDSPTVGLSPERAAEIERASWDTTRLLLEGIEAAEETETAETVIPEPEEANDTAPLSGDEKEFLRLCFTGGDAAAFARMRGRLPDSYADKINETASVLIGDIVLENTGAGYSVIADYTAEVSEWLSEK